MCMVGFPHGSVVKNPPANAGDRFDPWVRKMPWRRKWQPPPVLLPGKSHGQRRLEVATMDLKIAHTHMHTCISRNVGSALALEQDWEVWRQYT